MVRETVSVYTVMAKSWFLLLACFFTLLIGCTTSPYTGRSQFMLVSESQEVSLGKEAYSHILRDSVLSDDPEALRIVRKVGERIARAASKPDYEWEFRIINDPEMVNAFAVPGGKVAVYTGIFRPARDEAGLAVVLGHEVAHALLRHPGERMSQDMLMQLGGLGLSAALGSNPQLAKGVLGAYGLGAAVGWMLPFSRSQESEADRVGLILMAKAGYDPRVSLEVWERMEKDESGKNQGAPPEFLSTHPGYETRTQQLRTFIPEALRYYRPLNGRPARLPSPQSLDSPTAKAERELLTRLQKVNAFVEEPQGERAVVEALSYTLRTNPSLLSQERQQLRLGYGQYVALKAVSWLGRASLSRVAADYGNGVRWSDLAENHGTRLSYLLSWMGEFLRRTAEVHGRLRRQPPAPRFRTR
jgi:predicted Zn-dependent protease